jgi:hypothetical protein
VRRILRFDSKIRGGDIPSVPARYRGVSGPSGSLRDVRLRPRTGEGWIRLRLAAGLLGLKHETRVYPLSADQPPTPPPDVVTLQGGMRVMCHDGQVGELRGIMLDADTGAVLNLLVHVRGDVVASVESITNSLASLLKVAGRELLVPPAWAGAVKTEADRLFGGGEMLHLDATAEQIAACPQFRPDNQVAGDILAILDANPAIGPHLARVRVSVHDGSVTLRGTLPAARLRASAEQDVWHVPGVLALNNEIEIVA